MVQFMRSRYANMDGRWWFGIKRWPSKKFVADANGLSSVPWKLTGWFIGLGPVQVRIWPGVKKD